MILKFFHRYQKLGFGKKFTKGYNEKQWLNSLWNEARAEGKKIK